MKDSLHLAFDEKGKDQMRPQPYLNTTGRLRCVTPTQCCCGRSTVDMTSSETIIKRARDQLPVEKRGQTLSSYRSSSNCRRNFRVKISISMSLLLRKCNSELGHAAGLHESHSVRKHETRSTSNFPTKYSQCDLSSSAAVYRSIVRCDHFTGNGN